MICANALKFYFIRSSTMWLIKCVMNFNFIDTTAELFIGIMQIMFSTTDHFDMMWLNTQSFLNKSPIGKNSTVLILLYCSSHQLAYLIKSVVYFIPFVCFFIYNTTKRMLNIIVYLYHIWQPLFFVNWIPLSSDGAVTAV